MNKILLLSLLLLSLSACSPSEEKAKKATVDATETKIIEKPAPKEETKKEVKADIVIAEEDVLPMEKRGGDFTLYGVNGAVSLSDYKGKVVAIYFGYTQCPDVCPTNLALLGGAMKQMKEEEISNLQSIFISVDPGRDTPEHLADYTKYYHPNMIGISGTPDMIDPIVAKYGAFYEKVSFSNSAMIYGISHTSETYIVGKDGKLAAILDHAASVKEILKAIRSAMSQ